MKNSRNLPVPTQEPLAFEQPSLFIEHPVNGDVIHQHPVSGYINATEMCQQAGKLFGHYRELAQTEAFLKELSLDIGIPISNLVLTRRGRGDKVEQGTWVHPHVAINLGQWLSPAFAVQVSKWVTDWIQGKSSSFMPDHIQRYMKNKSKIPYTHFSMLNEIYLQFFAPLEHYGITPPDKIMPDISTGQMFSSFLRSKGIDTGQFPTYKHEFSDSSRYPVNARLYPIEYLADFRRYFSEVWLPDRAENYLADKFPKALPYLPRILQLPAGPPNT